MRTNNVGIDMHSMHSVDGTIGDDRVQGWIWTRADIPCSGTSVDWFGDVR